MQLCAVLDVNRQHDTKEKTVVARWAQNVEVSSVEVQKLQFIKKTYWLTVGWVTRIISHRRWDFFFSKRHTDSDIFILLQLELTLSWSNVGIGCWCLHALKFWIMYWSRTYNNYRADLQRPWLKQNVVYIPNWVRSRPASGNCNYITSVMIWLPITKVNVSQIIWNIATAQGSTANLK